MVYLKAVDSSTAFCFGSAPLKTGKSKKIILFETDLLFRDFSAPQ
jgi:hypothetical protein